MASKPFTPEEARRIVQFLQTPAVFLNMTTDWPALHWTVEHLSDCLTERLRFRIGKRTENMAPLFETECSYIEATINEFLSWTACEDKSLVGPFSDYHCKEFWAYADYKYIAQLFQDKPAMFQDMVWSDFGFPGRDGRDSTLWIGTQGANTPCHLDSYGCNLVFQIQGRKRWHLFPPDDTHCLYPTRIPYEESSVFSRVSVVHPDLKKFPAFRRARVHTVTLQPGQVLFVPRHWWHYVESVDPVTVSVNSWIEMDGVSSHDENMQYLNLAVKACMDKSRDDTDGMTSLADQPRAEVGKRDSSGLLKTPASPTFRVPFGPHLIPVNLAHKPNCTCPKDTSCYRYNDLSRGQSTAQDEYESRSVNELQRWGQHAHQEAESPRTSGEGSGLHISTNDMLQFLIHPDVITLVTRLMMSRQRELHS
uniref:Hspb associated protein 1 n=1 Tax=Cyprinus carpio TaxID=7962 RepID=A0A8C2JKN3_CYPCA